MIKQNEIIRVQWSKLKPLVYLHLLSLSFDDYEIKFVKSLFGTCALNLQGHWIPALVNDGTYANLALLKDISINLKWVWLWNSQKV